MSVREAAFPRRYPMVVIATHDGDTCAALLDQGGDSWWKVNIRLHGCAARELSDPGGPEARDYLAGLLIGITPPTLLDVFTAKWQGQCESLSWDKFAGRIQARIWLPGSAVDVSTLMIAAGFAAPWDGRGVQPKPAWPVIPPPA